MDIIVLASGFISDISVVECEKEALKEKAINFTNELVFNRISGNVRQNGHRTLIDSRQSDLGADLWIVSSPQGASVFIDDAYVGLTAVGQPISLAKTNWFKKVQAGVRQLQVRKVPYGNIQLRLRGIPDFDFGPDQEIEVKIPVTEEQIVLFANIFRQQVVDQRGRVYAVDQPNDPFQELEDEFGD